MIKTTLLGSALAVALSAAPAMAADFQALADLQGAAPTPLTDVVLAATEGGVVCVTEFAVTEALAVCAGGGVTGASAVLGVDALPPGLVIGLTGGGLAVGSAP